MGVPQQASQTSDRRLDIAAKTGMAAEAVASHACAPCLTYLLLLLRAGPLRAWTALAEESHAASSGRRHEQAHTA